MAPNDHFALDEYTPNRTKKAAYCTVKLGGWSSLLVLWAAKIRRDPAKKSHLGQVGFSFKSRMLPVQCVLLGTAIERELDLTVSSHAFGFLT